MATDGQKPESLGEDSLVSPHTENQNENSHFVLPLWTESLQQNNVQYPTPVNESQNDTNTQFSSPPENQFHFQQNFTQIRQLEGSCHVNPVTLETSCHGSPVTFSEALNSQHSEVPLQNIQDGVLNIQNSRTLNVQDGRQHNIQDGGVLNVQVSSALNVQDRIQHNIHDSRTLNVQVGRRHNIQDGGVLNTQDSSALNVQDGRQHNIQDSSVYTQISGVEGRAVSDDSYPGILPTAPSISESPNQATYSFSKIMSVTPQEQIPLSYTELLSSVQNTAESSKMVSQTSAARDCQALGVPHTETTCSSLDVGIPQVGVNPIKDKDLNMTPMDSFIEIEMGNEFAGTVPENEIKDKQTEVEGQSMNSDGLFDSKNSNTGTKTSKLEETPVDLLQGKTGREEKGVPVKLMPKNPEDIKKPVRKISSKNGKRKQEGQTQKAVKRKLRQNNSMDVSETSRAGTLRSGKKTKRSRKKELVDTPVEYEIVKHENDLPQGETIEIESYNDILAELNSMKDEYIKLQNTLTDVEIKYNTLLSTNNIKKEEDPELFSNKIISTIASYFNKPLFSDIQVLLGENHILQAHKLILSARSEYWGLQHLYYIDKLDLTGVRQEVGYELMKWVYTDELDTKVDVSFMIEILHASVKYKLDGLFKRCEKGLISLININNCENLKEVAEDLNCTELTEECQQFLDVHQIAPVSPLIEEDTEEVLDDLDNEEDSDFEPSVVFEEKKKRGLKSLKGLKDKKRMKIRNKKKISSIVEKLHHKKLSEAVDEELGTKLSNRIERLEMKARILAGEKPYQCEQCGRAFAAKGNLKRHISMHSDDKPFECGICRKGFKTNSEVKRHNIVHSGEKRFMCDICSMCFSAGSSLHRHMRIHRGEKPYQCEACGKSFRSSGDVTKHNLTHTGEKPYKCPVCSKPFSRTQHVKKHMGIHKRQLGLQFQENQYPDYVKVSQND